MNRHIQRSEPAIARANGIELVYDTFGDPGAPALLLIMGFGSQMIAWDEDFCGELASRGFWVVRFDNRDIGLSAKFDHLGIPNMHALWQAYIQGQPVTAPYTLRDMANDTVGLMDALGIESAHVVGASMGGAIGQELAIHHPNRLRTLTSIMSSTGDPTLPQPKAEALAVLSTPRPTDQAAYFEGFVQTWRILRGSGFPLDEARDVERAAQTWARGLSPAGVARQFAAVMASGSRKEALKSVNVPTLVIHGDCDPLVPVECGIDTANTIPGAKLVIIKGMGHALPIPMWGQVIDAIAQHAV
jgi:pimeloyl-ACP methyl ester carboxylesterase